MGDPIPGRLTLIALFVLGSIVVMFIDGLVFDNYNSRPSMAMMHMEMKPVIYADPKAPSLEEYWSSFRQLESSPSDPDTPMEPEIIVENGRQIKLYRVTMNNVLHELRPGVKVPMFSFNNQIPAPSIRVQEGDIVRIIFRNDGTDPHTIHWHGVNNISPEFDGVPDVNQPPVLPGETFTYEFTANPTGTKMYHCHVEAPHHMAMGMFGAIIIDPLPKNGGVNAHAPFGNATKEQILFFSEFESKHAHVAYPSDMMPMGPDGDLPWLNSPGNKFMMPFMPEFDEFLINGKSFPAVPPIRVQEGDVVRLRLLNIGMRIHSLHIHGHEFTVTHRDGYPLSSPFTVDTLLIGPGERYDVWLEANNPGIWMVHDHAGENAMAKGYDPAGIMTVIAYDGYENEAYTTFLTRVRAYNEAITHMDVEHGGLTPDSPVSAGMDMGGMDMGGMDMGGH